MGSDSCLNHFCPWRTMLAQSRHSCGFGRELQMNLHSRWYADWQTRGGMAFQAEQYPSSAAMGVRWGVGAQKGPGWVFELGKPGLVTAQWVQTMSEEAAAVSVSGRWREQLWTSDEANLRGLVRPVNCGFRGSDLFRVGGDPAGSFPQVSEQQHAWPWPSGIKHPAVSPR